MAEQLEILSKFTIGGQELKNRLVLAPMTRARCTDTGNWLDPITNLPNDLMAEYYEQRATAGLIVTEATAISEDGSGWPCAPHIRTPEQVEEWKKTTDRVHAKGGVIYLQLWHMGRQAHSSLHPTKHDIVSASAIPIVNAKAKTVADQMVDFETPRALTIEDIQQTVQDFVQAGKLAKEAGFDGIEIHGANGYLLDQFFQKSTNIREDQYGGSMENRFRICKEVIEALVADGSFPANRIGIRLSPNGAYGDMGSDDNDVMFPYIAKQLSTYGLAYLHIMDGLGFGYHGKCKAVTVYDIKKNFDGPIIANVGLTKEIAEGMIRSGAADLACFGRKYISNPDLPERFANGWPLAEDAPYETWWQHTGAKGYTDWPVYSP